MRPVEDYWRDRVELVTALKEGAVARVATSVDHAKEDEGSSGGDSKQKGIALLGGGSGLGAMSRLAQATRAALAAVGPPPPFDPLALFMVHLEMEYGGFRRDKMHRIQDFRREKKDIPRTMYTRLAPLAVEAGDVFTEC